MKTKMFFATALIALVLIFVGCDNVTSPAGNNEITVPGDSLADKLAWMESNAASNSTYILTVDDDAEIEPNTLFYAGKTGITLHLQNGNAAGRSVSQPGDVTISLDPNAGGSLFTVGNGVTLVLDDGVILRGHNQNSSPLLLVKAGGTLVMNGGEISGNTSTTVSGVRVDENGTFTMSGGEISSNTSTAFYSSAVVYLNSDSTFTMSGGKISGNSTTGDEVAGVKVYRATFTMSGGKISDLTTKGMIAVGVSVSGGTFAMSGGEISGNKSGVEILSGTFAMKGGKISGNIATDGGGGVYVDYGTFTMSGGEISGNANYGGGGGVGVGYGTFTMSGGKISGNTDLTRGGGVLVSGGTFTMNGGEISGNMVSIGRSYSPTHAGGGGVHVGENSTFAMNGGVISGNTVNDANGGGVHVLRGTFTKSGGTIYGSNSESNSNTATQGNAAYLDSYTTKYYRNSTAGPSVTMNSGTVGTAGGWNN